MTTFTGAEFAKALTAGEVRTPLHIEGMAKPAEKDEAAILFSPAGCERWVRLPVELIEAVEHLGEMPCKDHAHPHVRIRLKAAVGHSVEGQLLAAMAASATRPAAGGTTGRPPRTGCDPYTGECIWVTELGGYYRYQLRADCSDRYLRCRR